MPLGGRSRGERTHVSDPRARRAVARSRRVIVDAHHHFWDPTRRQYPWMGPELEAIRRPFGPDDLRPLVDDNGVDRTILVQTISSVDETREFLETAAAN